MQVLVRASPTIQLSKFIQINLKASAQNVPSSNFQKNAARQIVQGADVDEYSVVVTDNRSIGDERNMRPRGERVDS